MSSKQIISNFPFTSNGSGRQVVYGDPMGPGNFSGTFVGDFSGTIDGVTFNTSSLTYALVSIPTAIHGVPITMSNPFNAGTAPIGFVPQFTVSGTASSSLTVQQVDFSMSSDPNNIYLTPYYDLNHTLPYVSVANQINTSITNNSQLALSWSSAYTTNNSVLSWSSADLSSSRIHVKANGLYNFVGFTSLTAHQGTGQAWIMKNGNSSERIVQTQTSGGLFTTRKLNLSTVVTASAGDYFELIAVQDSGGTVSFAGSVIDRSFLYVSRLFNQSIPTGSLTGLLIGNSVGGIGSVNVNTLQTGNYSGSFTGSFNGNYTGSFSGSQFKFPATQQDSLDANTLDDYEEGVWTPSYVLTGGSYTYNTPTYGFYTKVGRHVSAGGRISLLTGVLASNVAVRLGGLPFTPTSSFVGAGHVGYVAGFNSVTGQIVMRIGSGVVNIAIQNNGGNTELNASTHIGLTSDFFFGLEYDI